MFKFLKNRQKGSVFTVLLAGVAMAGTLSVILYQVISGPMASVVRVSNKTAAKNQLQSISNIVIMDAINLTANGGDCDNDGYVEPREWRTPLTGVNVPQGGGLIPNDIGAPLTDPWGSDYGYCVWDIGTANDPTTEVIDGVCGAPANRLSGNPDPVNHDIYGGVETQTVLAIISAGPDRQFDSGTECKSYIDKNTAVLTLGGDDFIQSYTYNEAATATSSLWKIRTTDPNIAEIDKNITVGDPTLTETPDELKDQTSGIIRALAVLTQGMIEVGGPLRTLGVLEAGDAIRLADENAVTDCLAENTGDMRYNKASKRMETCNGTEWKASVSGDFKEGAVPFANNEGELSQDINDNKTPLDDTDDFLNLKWDETSDALTVGNMITFVGETADDAEPPVTANPMLADLDDVTITNPEENQILGYVSGVWVNKFSDWRYNASDLYFNTGNVGIGTDTPAYLLDVAGSIQATAFYDGDNNAYYLDPTATTTSLRVAGGIWANSSLTGANIELYHATPYIDFHYSSGSTDYNTRIINSSSGILQYVATTSYFTGNVGIGTSTPGATLEVNGNIITTPNRSLPKLVLDSDHTAGTDEWTDQGAQISIGETTTASLHMTYRGDGYGFIGSGAVVSGVPGNDAGSYLRFDYNSDEIYTPDIISAAAFSDSADATYYLNPADTTTSLNVAGALLAPSATLTGALTSGSISTGNIITSGNITIPGVAGVDHYLGDDASTETAGVVLRVKTNPASGDNIFSVLSGGYSERLRVEHDGYLSTTNSIYVSGVTLNNYIAGNLGIGTTSPSEKLEVNGNIITTPNRSLPKIILDSDGTADTDNWTNQGAQISLGESGDGAASLHLTYRGDGYGYIGSGALSNGIPEHSYLRFDYDSSNIYTPDTITVGGAIHVNNTAPTIYMRDSDHRSAMIHTNSNLFYILRGKEANSSTWEQYNSVWPFVINLETNNATVGGSLTAESFIDRNGTAYYLNPASTDISLYAAGDLVHFGKDIFSAYDGATNANNDYIRADDDNNNSIAVATGSTVVYSLHGDSARDVVSTSATGAISAKGGYFINNVGIGAISAADKLMIAPGGSRYYRTRYITANSEDSAGVNYILLHKAYNGTLMNEYRVQGKVSARRGGTGAWNRKWVVEVNTGTAYSSTRGSAISYNEASRLVTLTYSGTKYLALVINSSSALYGFTFQGEAYAHDGELLKYVKDTDVSSVAEFTDHDAVTVAGPLTTTDQLRINNDGTIGNTSANIGDASIRLYNSTGYDMVLDPNEVSVYGQPLYLTGEDGLYLRVGDLADSDAKTGLIVGTNGYVGIGGVDTTPDYPLEIEVDHANYSLYNLNNRTSGGTAYGIYNRAYTTSGTATGLYSSAQTVSGTAYGANIYAYSGGTGVARGIYLRADSDAGTGYAYGIDADIYTKSTSTNYGQRWDIYNSGAGGSTYGQYINVDTDGTSGGTAYGSRIYAYARGGTSSGLYIYARSLDSGNSYGIEASAYSYGSSGAYGGYFYANAGGTGIAYGLRTYGYTNGTKTAYGVYARSNSSAGAAGYFYNSSSASNAVSIYANKKVIIGWTSVPTGSDASCAHDYNTEILGSSSASWYCGTGALFAHQSGKSWTAHFYASSGTALKVNSCSGCSVISEMVKVKATPRNGDAMCINPDTGLTETCEKDKSPFVKGVAQKYAEQVLRSGCAFTEQEGKDGSNNSIDVGVVDVNAILKRPECKGWYPIALDGLSEETNVVCSTPSGRRLKYGDSLVTSGKKGYLRPLDYDENRWPDHVVGKADTICGEGKETDSIHVWLN